MAFVWMVECKTCLQPFPAERRELVEGKSTDSLVKGKPLGARECPHCHEIHDYVTDDCYPGEGRLPQ